MAEARGIAAFRRGEIERARLLLQGRPQGALESFRHVVPEGLGGARMQKLGGRADAQEGKSSVTEVW